MEILDNQFEAARAECRGACHLTRATDPEKAEAWLRGDPMPYINPDNDEDVSGASLMDKQRALQCGSCILRGATAFPKNIILGEE